MKLYDLILNKLTNNSQARNSDKILMWEVWTDLGLIYKDNFTLSSFMDDRCPTPESITRCRRKIQEKHPELQANEQVKRMREEKAEEKGTFVYREQVQPTRRPTWEEFRQKLEADKQKATLAKYLK